MMPHDKDSHSNVPKTNLFWFALWALLEAVQWIIVVAFIFSFIPFKPHPFAAKLFALHQKGVQPEREMTFYRLFVVLSALFYAAGLYVFRRRLEDRGLSKKLWPLAMVNAIWIFVQVFAVFKIFVTGNPDWARYLLYAGFAGALVTRVFWPEICLWAPRLYAAWIVPNVPRIYLRAWHAVFCVFLGAVIFVPDMTKVLARMFVRDQFYHIDSFLMAPGWAHLSGLLLNQDVISQYSSVLPIVVSRLAQWMGGLNYQNAVAILMWASILYFIGLYFFLRRWLASSLIAAFGTLLAVKVQMFHWGVAPIIWQFPSATVVRYVFDLPVLWLLWQHCQNPRAGYLWAAACLCGMSLAWMQDTGVYLLAAYYVYLAIDFLTSGPGYRSLKNIKGLASGAVLLLTPFCAGLLVLLLLQGPSVLARDFWINTGEFAGLFLKGWGSLPMYDGLKERQFFAYIMGFIIPAVYAVTMVFIGTLCFLKQIERKNLFAIVVCVYGLGLYHYFIGRSAVSSYYVVGIPFIAVLCYWLRMISSTFSRRVENAGGFLALVVMVGALLTSYWVTYYPNVFDFAGGAQWEEEVRFYKQEFDLSRDAAMISRLTNAQERVAVVSSFEVKFLMDAGRKPFFYYFPLIESSHLRLASFRGTYLHTHDRMKRTLEQLEAHKPEYVFIEQKLFRRQIPPGYYQLYQTLETLIKYLDEHYAPAEDGLYLMALKRKP